MKNKELETIIKSLNLIPHPVEGGYFREVYRSKSTISKEGLNGFSGDRNYCTSIYYLLTSANFSAFHRIKQDEIWHFYKGSPMYVHVIDLDGTYTRHEVGLNIEEGEVPQLAVTSGCWFASSVKNENDFSFVGCTVAPGFDFEDFEMAKREQLVAKYPKHKEVIESLTR